MVAATAARISTTDATRAPIAASAQSKPLSADCAATGWAMTGGAVWLVGESAAAAIGWGAAKLNWWPSTKPDLWRTTGPPGECDTTGS